MFLIARNDRQNVSSSDVFERSLGRRGQRGRAAVTFTQLASNTQHKRFFLLICFASHKFLISFCAPFASTRCSHTFFNANPTTRKMVCVAQYR